MKRLNKGELSQLVDHVNSGLEDLDKSHLQFTKFTISPKTDDLKCKIGYHKEWVPVGDGSFELQCVPDNVPPKGQRQIKSKGPLKSKGSQPRKRI